MKYKKLLGGILLACLTTTPALASEYSATFFATSAHPISSGEYNSKHNFVGIEYIENGVGYSISTFKNSYYKQSIMYSQTAYIDNNQDYKVFLMAGAVSGYEDTGAICLVKAGSICGTIGAGIVWQYHELQPRVTIFGEAVVFSLAYAW